MRKNSFGKKLFNSNAPESDCGVILFNVKPQHMQAKLTGKLRYEEFIETM